MHGKGDSSREGELISQLGKREEKQILLLGKGRKP